MRFWVVASVYVPVAVNCCVRPFAIEGVAGVTPMETSVAAVTVSVVLPDTAPSVAEMTVVPTAAELARPCEPPALLMVAVAGVAEAHVAVVVRFWVVASVYVPVAVNCCFKPFAIEGVAGVTPMETSVAAVTVSVVLPDTAPSVAEMTVVPAALVTARPEAALIVATVASLVDHVAIAVRSWVVASENVPVAVNCFGRPFGTVGVAGVMLMDASVALVTVAGVVVVAAPEVALMLAGPSARPASKPDVLTDAAGASEAHVTCVLKSCVVWSVNVPIATSCLDVPFASVGAAGVMFNDTSVADVTVTSMDLDRPALVAVTFAMPALTAVTSPFTTVASFTSLLCQVTTAPACLDPSLKRTVAINVDDVPAASERTAGVTSIDVGAGCEGRPDGVSPPPQAPASRTVTPRNRRASHFKVLSMAGGTTRLSNPLAKRISRNAAPLSEMKGAHERLAPTG